MNEYGDQTSAGHEGEGDQERIATGRGSGLAVAVLVFLSPVLTELLAGIVHITNLWLLVPEMAVYGGAALLVREVVRRRQRGWVSIMLLGIAYALVEECVILQTSLTPQFFAAGTGSFGWALGVQWNYLCAMLGYEGVYAIVLPIALTELLFPKRRKELWLDRRGLTIAAAVFVLGAIGVWWLWSHVGVRRYGASTYQVPVVNIVLAVVVIVLLIAVALFVLPIERSRAEARRRAWSPWLLGVIAFIFSFFWWLLVAFAYVPAATLQGVSPVVPLCIALVWALLAFFSISHLSHARGWQDRHRLGLIFGAVLASMLGGTLSILAGTSIDKLGKLVFDVIALVLLVRLAWSLRKAKTDRVPLPE
jgi:hypothetical protein